MQDWFEDFIHQKQKELKDTHTVRELPIINSNIQAKVSHNNKELLNLASNNYLQLDTHTQEASLQNFDFGAGSSRYITGNHKFYSLCEEAISQWLKTEKTLLFSCGYLTNLGVIETLSKAVDVICADRECHSSIMQAIQKGHQQKTYFFKHNSISHLEDCLRKACTPKHSKILIISEGMFSMTGDHPSIEGLHTCIKKYKAICLIDEAHSLGCYGQFGEGLVASYPKKSSSIFITGTFSKALGSYGGFVTGPQKMIDWIKNDSKTSIYTTALPPVIIHENIQRIKQVQRASKKRAYLQKISQLLYQNIPEKFLTLNPTWSPIIPIILGSAHKVLKNQQDLIDRGFWVPAIRTPSIPKNTERLRISINTSISIEQIESLIQALHSILPLS